jgi:hypothetical protein
MDKIQNDYPNVPVDTSKHEIRVLELFPGARGTKIHCSLVCLSLSENHIDYEALSYAWSNPAERSVIALSNNENFQIPSRLEAALQDLRLDERHLMIWIDAICIDQSNIEERNAQVQLMRRVYRQATAVRIWLDMDISIHDPAIIKLRTLTEKSTIEDLGSKPFFWKPVNEILENPYWKRVWIQQEITNASSLLLQCGSQFLPFEPLYPYTRLMRSKLDDQDCIQRALWLFWKPKVDIVRISGTSRYSLIDSVEPDLLSTLAGCAQAGLHCSDDRDRVYSVLYLAEDYAEGEIRIDYSMSLAQVYASVPEYMINKYNSLDFLLCASANKASAKTELPSWVPDWRNWKSEFKYHDISQNAATSFFGRTAEVSWVSRSRRTLHVQGFCIDTLDRVFQDIEGHSFPVTQVSTFLNTCAEIVREAAQRQNGVILEPDDWAAIFSSPLWNSLVRTLTWFYARQIVGRKKIKSYYQSSRDLLPMIQGYKSYFGEDLMINRFLFQNLHPTARDFGDLLTTIWLALLCRFPFVGSNGGIGLATELSQVGDEVWILFGCSRPMILRRQDSHYIVVGSAYLDGAMDGDILRGMPKHIKEGESLGDYKIESISLR